MKFLFERRVNHSSYELRMKVSKFHSDVLVDEDMKIEVITNKTVIDTEEPIVTSNVNEALDLVLYDEAVASVLWMPRSCAKLRGEEEGDDVIHVDVKSRSDSKRINE